MRENINIKNIKLVAKSEYIRWLATPKMLLLAAVFLPLRDLVVSPLLMASAEMDSPLNMLEPCIATLNSWTGTLLLSLVYLFLLSPFPTTDGNMMFYIARMGRRNWILGEMLFQVSGVLTYGIITSLVTVLQVFQRSFIANGWSLVVTEYDEHFRTEGGAKISGIIPPNLYFQMAPYQAFLLSFALFSLFLLFCGMLFLAGCLYQKRLLFFFVQVVHITVGCGMILLDGTAMWFFPVAHSLLLRHYSSYFRKYVFSPWLSLALFGAVLAATGIIIYRKAGKVNLDITGGGVFS